MNLTRPCLISMFMCVISVCNNSWLPDKARERVEFKTRSRICSYYVSYDKLVGRSSWLASSPCLQTIVVQAATLER